MFEKQQIEADIKCSLCGGHTTDLGSHLREVHGEEALRRMVLTAKGNGMSDVQIGARFGVSFNYLEQIITEAYGVNISVLKRPKRIKYWIPKKFREETTTVWSFKRRGDWATHDGRYRGNWSPYIPRNIILKYSCPGDVVLDYFVGGGTTAIEAKLLGRRCIARDINPGAIGITLENLRFAPPRELFDEETLPLYDPEVAVGDARDLSDIPDNSIDLICAHPPYAGIIKYSTNVEGDLSKLSVQEFLRDMRLVAQESLRVLKPGGKCAILIGDARSKKHVVPTGFQTIKTFLSAGFMLRELVIKCQHNCKTTGFWYNRSIKYNFLLLAHEYLSIFEKPKAENIAENRSPGKYILSYHSARSEVWMIEEEKMETTTVWIFPKERMKAEIQRNLLKRFAIPESYFLEIDFDINETASEIRADRKPSLVYIASPEQLVGERDIIGYRAKVVRIGFQASDILSNGGFLVVDTKDVRINGVLRPMGLLLWKALSTQDEFSIKEIVIVLPEDSSEKSSVPEDDDHLQIIHRYLLIFTKQDI